MRTKINDAFPLDEIECQFFETCKHYDSNRCAYGAPCYKKIHFKNKETTTRSVLRKTLEGYVGEECLKYQIKTILEEK